MVAAGPGRASPPLPGPPASAWPPRGPLAVAAGALRAGGGRGRAAPPRGGGAAPAGLVRRRGGVWPRSLPAALAARGVSPRSRSPLAGRRRGACRARGGPTVPWLREELRAAPAAMFRRGL